MGKLIQLFKYHRPIHPGTKVKLGEIGKYTITRVEGYTLYGILDGYPGVVRCITSDYRRPVDPRLTIHHIDGYHIQG